MRCAMQYTSFKNRDGNLELVEYRPVKQWQRSSGVCFVPTPPDAVNAPPFDPQLPLHQLPAAWTFRSTPPHQAQPKCKLQRCFLGLDFLGEVKDVHLIWRSVLVNENLPAMFDFNWKSQCLEVISSQRHIAFSNEWWSLRCDKYGFVHTPFIPFWMKYRRRPYFKNNEPADVQRYPRVFSIFAGFITVFNCRNTQSSKIIAKIPSVLFGTVIYRVLRVQLFLNSLTTIVSFIITFLSKWVSLIHFINNGQCM